MKVKSRKSLVREADKQFSLYIRARDDKETGGLCVFASTVGCMGRIEHCFHFITRAKYVTRWDAYNAVASCAGCNLRMEYDPHKYIQWYINKHGLEAYEELIRTSNEIVKYDRADLESIAHSFKVLREAL